MFPEETTFGIESKLRSIESRVGYQLPSDYCDFMKSGKQATAIGRTFHIPECKAAATIGNLLDFDESYGLFVWLNEIGDELPAAHFPIGFDPGGNAIIMDATTGWIYYWDSARHFPGSSDEDNVYLIAKSFSEFLDGLYD
ncbi:MAG: SMI1/KNR4 family protein [Planctomycetaceae bacterium]|nr:SMI1/KNR4 family protein [Planctomycetaceae bacterium]